MDGRTAGSRLKDVALAAGVSATTISRYLNHKLVLPENTAWVSAGRRRSG